MTTATATDANGLETEGPDKWTGPIRCSSESLSQSAWGHGTDRLEIRGTYINGWWTVWVRPLDPEFRRKRWERDRFSAFEKR